MRLDEDANVWESVSVCTKYATQGCLHGRNRRHQISVRRDINIIYSYQLAASQRQLRTSASNDTRTRPILTTFHLR